MMNSSWLICPVYGGKTRDQIRKDTVLINYPLYCPKCKQTTLINVNELNTTVIKEPDAKPIIDEIFSWLSALSFLIFRNKHSKHKTVAI